MQHPSVTVQRLTLEAPIAADWNAQAASMLV
jgi:hypothetical protein